MKRNNDYCLHFDLVQQSPLMIKKEQFQNDMPIHTILYSELVPALNRFLTKQKVKFGIKHRDEQRKGYAYNFRVEIVGSNILPGFFTFERYDKNKLNQPVEHFGGYFGYVILDKIPMKITSPDKALIDALSDQLPGFFLNYLFGGKKSKGFGQFIESDTDQSHITAYINALYSDFHVIFRDDNTVFPGHREGEVNARYKPKFLDDYKVVKSGVNFGERDTRPIIRSKLRTKVFQSVCWEKKAIKLALKNIKHHRAPFSSWYDDLKVVLLTDVNMPDKPDPTDGTNSQSQLFIRPIMGLSGHFEFLKQHPELGNSKDKIIVTVESLGEHDVTKPGEIVRFPSQVRFQIFHGKVYCLIPRFGSNEKIRQISHKPFKFIAKNNERNQIVLINEIRTPDYTDAHLKSIMKCFIELGWRT